MKEIALNQGFVVLIEDEDFDLVCDLRWSAALTSPGKRYAVTKIDRRTTYMHRLILGAAKGQVVDHINGDGLDNRRCNLRLGTSSDNAVNRAYPLPPSGFRGVYFWDKRWVAHICKNGKQHYLGRYDTPELAAEAYDMAARELHGSFAITNFNQGQ